MKRFSHEEGIAIDWAWIDQRAAADAKRLRDAAAKRNLKALRAGVKGATIGPELADYLWENTRSRHPDADDVKQAKLLAKQGYDNSFISAALELVPERVVEALA